MSIRQHLYPLTLAILLVSSYARAASPVAIMRDAQRAYIEGRTDDALTLYEQAKNETDGDLSVLYNMALCQMNLGRADEAVRSFETVAANANQRDELRRDALYNIGVLIASRARRRLESWLAPTSQPAPDDEAPDMEPTAPATPTAQSQPAEPAREDLTIEDLESIAANMLRAIDFLRQAERVGGPADDIEHNIRAARAIRREVLGLIRQSQEARAEEEMQKALEDPQAYLKKLMQEQQLQASVSRRLIRYPDPSPSQQRRQRRVALRLQRDTLDRAATLVDHLEQFTETVDDATGASPPSTQPTTPSPREQLYRAAAGQLRPALDHQRDACAFLLEGDLAATHSQQNQSLATLRAAEAMFPLDPTQALAEWYGQQRQLAGVVDSFEAPADWSRDPFLPSEEGLGTADGDATTQPAASEPDDIPVLDGQQQIGSGIERLIRQAQAVAAQESTTTTTAPPDAPQGETDPRLDPEINRRLAEVLSTAMRPQERALSAIRDRDRGAARSAQDRVADKLLEALNLFPKSLEQRLQELIARQGELNTQVAAVGQKDAPDENAHSTPVDSWRALGRNWLSQLQSIFTLPEALTRDAAEKQEAIDTETRTVEEEVKQQATQMAGQSSGTQDPQVQAYLEASRHLGEADRQMLAAIEELKLASVEASLNRLRDEGPVQTAQTAALDALIRALESLNPERDEDEEEQQDENEDSTEQQQPQPRQDIRRAMQRLDRERAQAERQLYQNRQSRVIKDW